MLLVQQQQLRDRKSAHTCEFVVDSHVKSGVKQLQSNNLSRFKFINLFSGNLLTNDLKSMIVLMIIFTAVLFFFFWGACFFF